MTIPPQIHPSPDHSAPCQPSQTDPLTAANSHHLLSLPNSDPSASNVSQVTAAAAAAAAAAVASSFSYHQFYMDPVTATAMFYQQQQQQQQQQQHHHHHHLSPSTPAAPHVSHVSNHPHLTPVPSPHLQSHLHGYASHPSASTHQNGHLQFPVTFSAHPKSLQAHAALGPHPAISVSQHQQPAITNRHYPSAARALPQPQSHSQSHSQSQLPPLSASTDAYAQPSLQAQEQQQQLLNPNIPSHPNGLPTHPYYMHNHSSVTAVTLQQMQLAHHLQMQQMQYAQHAQHPRSQSESQPSLLSQPHLQLQPGSVPPLMQSNIPSTEPTTQEQPPDVAPNEQSNMAPGQQLPITSQSRPLSNGAHNSHMPLQSTQSEAAQDGLTYTQDNGTETESSPSSSQVYNTQASTLLQAPTVAVANSHTALPGITKRIYDGGHHGLPAVPDTQMESAFRIGRYTPAERRMRLERYREKRSARNYNRRVKYDCRKMIADKRVRVQGRFVKREEEAALVAASIQEKHQVDNNYVREPDGGAQSLELGDGTPITSNDSEPHLRGLQNSDFDEEDDNDCDEQTMNMPQAHELETVGMS